jgi:DNA-binding NtrC family response regulator
MSTPIVSEHTNEPRSPNSGEISTGREAVRPLPVGREARAGIKVLIIDDEHTLREGCASVLQGEGYDVTTCGRGQEALDMLRRRPFDIVLTDLYMTQVSGMELMKAALAANRETIVVVMTGNPSLESSIDALRQGAWDYLPKPFSASHLQILIGRAAHTLLVSRERTSQDVELDSPGGGTGEKLTMLGGSPMFRDLITLAKKVAPTDASVFITGESGSGKELIARFIHQNSRRSSRPFVAINCAAMPETLLESEMFGHRKGAFTGAVRDKPGLFETASGGTLFLDELLEMPKTIQAKLLRVIQDGVVRRVGSEGTDAVVNVRIIAATNGDPDAATRSGDLREDLYYRLKVVPLRVPPLRERPEDIPVLAEHFLRAYWARHRRKGTPSPSFTESALRALSAHPWRGNVRELQNVIEHTVVLVDPGSEIGAEQLALSSNPGAPSELSSDAMISTVLGESYHAARDRVIAQFERQYLTWLINRAGGNMSKAARIAGVDRTTLYRLMERHGLQRSHSAAWLVSRDTAPAASGVGEPDGIHGSK